VSKRKAGSVSKPKGILFNVLLVAFGSIVWTGVQSYLSSKVEDGLKEQEGWFVTLAISPIAPWLGVLLAAGVAIWLGAWVDRLRRENSELRAKEGKADLIGNNLQLVPGDLRDFAGAFEELAAITPCDALSGDMNSGWWEVHCKIMEPTANYLSSIFGGSLESGLRKAKGAVKQRGFVFEDWRKEPSPVLFSEDLQAKAYFLKRLSHRIEKYDLRNLDQRERLAVSPEQLRKLFYDAIDEGFPGEFGN
jgi:hypothetical protein